MDKKTTVLSILLGVTIFVGGMLTGSLHPEMSTLLEGITSAVLSLTGIVIIFFSSDTTKTEA